MTSTSVYAYNRQRSIILNTKSQNKQIIHREFPHLYMYTEDAQDCTKYYIIILHLCHELFQRTVVFE